MKDDKLENRYLEYLGTYLNIILEFGEDLQKQVKKSRSGDVSIRKKKYKYFLITNGITVVNKKNNLEVSFHFNNNDENVYFEKSKFHYFIESDLNASGLGKDFPPNKMLRDEKFEICFNKLVTSGTINKHEKGYLISKEEVEFL